jgi:hypothetical protein
MARHKVLAALVIAGSVAGALVWRQRSAQRREHVDLYFADGSMVSFKQGALEADRLLPLAHGVLDAARGGPA